ncbi:MAG: hypothetical protein UT63_C0021G0007 [Candidatus Gottesmanbacteria bacterium GW2011_GWC2_39_8]|uniref:YtkA-like domain-containing protein n=1 Tax=Candidatus Gottesmanbacteria bacterium GW2011_GWC2_39_8 TaxID=1618450 RepID=A0A0G0PYI2_9BACT|nr:MAG: hypothetical protein UT63_C0021G0007 [Candidatus Gottesmanbacteria bacterium GW2011_GWC2_39_8]
MEKSAENENENKKATNLLSNKFAWVGALVGVVLLAAFGWYFLVPRGPKYAVIMVDAKNEVPTEGVATFTWRIEGPPININHTSVHFGQISDPGEFNTEMSHEQTKYTDQVKDFADGNYSVPLQFVGNAKIEKSGKYYMRVHALIEGKNYWSPEFNFEAK